MLVTCGEIAHPDYVAETWQVYLIFPLLLVVQGFLTTQSTKFIGRMNKVGTVYNVVLVLIFVIWFPLGSINTPKTKPSREVWTTFENGTDWPVGWSTIMGESFLHTSLSLSRCVSAWTDAVPLAIRIPDSTLDHGWVSPSTRSQLTQTHHLPATTSPSTSQKNAATPRSPLRAQ